MASSSSSNLVDDHYDKASSSSSFAGEAYLQGDVNLPNYNEEQFWISLGLLSVVLPFWWIGVLGYGWSRIQRVRRQSQQQQQQQHQKMKKMQDKASHQHKPPTTTTQEQKQQKHKRQQQSPFEANSGTDDWPPECKLVLFVLVGFVVTCTLLALTCIPNNVFAGRTVFVAPLLTEPECHELLDRAHAVAQLNYQRALSKQSSSSSSLLLQPPHGWNKQRHDSYPTTDLNWVTDPFAATDTAWLQELLNRRLAPLIGRLYGIPPASLRANDLFVVRYDATYRTALANHTDDSDISFNVLLTAPTTPRSNTTTITQNQHKESEDNEDNNDYQDSCDGGFEGGGTRFWNRWKKVPFIHGRRSSSSFSTTASSRAAEDDDEDEQVVRPNKAGTVLIHSARIHHEGFPITTGCRVLLVGFVAVDRIHPYWNDDHRYYHHRDASATTPPIKSHAPPSQWTGANLYATWFNVNWLAVKFKGGYDAASFALSRRQKQASSSSSTQQQRGRRSEGRQSTTTDTTRWGRLFRFLWILVETLGDAWLPHRVVDLVDDTNWTAYLIALDRQYSTPTVQASWFHGQQVSLDLWGRIYAEWRPRDLNRFQEL